MRADVYSCLLPKWKWGGGSARVSPQLPFESVQNWKNHCLSSVAFRQCLFLNGSMMVFSSLFFPFKFLLSFIRPRGILRSCWIRRMNFVFLARLPKTTEEAIFSAASLRFKECNEFAGRRERVGKKGFLSCPLSFSLVRSSARWYSLSKYCYFKPKP